MTKSLSKAIALATALGAAASAHAINVNQDGLGEVLLYSLYTTEQGNNTNVRITNTTPYAKAVKVRFVEGQNSQEVLDFNLYLSPFDQWSGAVTQTETGAKLVTADKSCTAPAIPAAGVDFRNFEYLGKGGEQTTARTRVGHIEVIEMGVLEDGLAALVTANHEVPGSAPANCGAIIAKFKTPSDPWYDPATAIPPGSIPATTPQDLQAGIITLDANDVRVTGGLYGSANVVNVDGATQIAYDAVVIDNFLGDSIHNLPGNNAPDLDSGQLNGVSQAVFKNGTSAIYSSSAPAVSALLMKEAMSNDFVVADALKAETNWVVTFPTKRFHVNSIPVIPPFVNPWNTATGTSCHNIDVAYWDHEEYAPTGSVSTGDIDFSPLPPVITPDAPVAPALCYETNVITFNEKSVLGGEFVNYNLNLPAEYQLGWMEIGFNGDSQTGAFVPYVMGASVTGADVNGLPAIGFAATTVKNNNASGVLKNYGSSVQHKSKTTFDH